MGQFAPIIKSKVKFFGLAIALLALPFSPPVAKTKSKTPLKKTKIKASFYNKKHLLSKWGSWGIDPKHARAHIKLDKAWTTFTKIKNVTVAVVDTGIDPNHPFLNKNLKYNNSVKGFGRDFSKNNKKTTTPSDQHGHGTHVSGIIKSVFPDVKILPLKYYNPQATGQDNLDSTIKALEFAVDAGVDIINYSGGGPEPAIEELRVLKKAEKKGILVVAAAGNEKTSIDDKKNAYYPASYGLKNIITVTAHDQKSQILKSSNWGKNSVDLSAPGHRIKSSIPKARAGYMTGTSQATAFVTGVASLIKSNFPLLSSFEIKRILKRSAAKDPALIGKVSTSGKLDAYQALKLSKEVAKIKERTNKLRKTASKKKKKRVFLVK